MLAGQHSKVQLALFIQLLQAQPVFPVDGQVLEVLGFGVFGVVEGEPAGFLRYYHSVTFENVHVKGFQLFQILRIRCIPLQFVRVVVIDVEEELVVLEIGVKIVRVLEVLRLDDLATDEGGIDAQLQ